MLNNIDIPLTESSAERAKYWQS